MGNATWKPLGEILPKNPVFEISKKWSNILLLLLLLLLLLIFINLTNLIDVSNIGNIIINLRKLQNSSTSKILIFWPKMTKCQTNLVRKKNFYRFFFAFFRLRIIQIENFFFFWKISFFLKILTQNDPFWPKFGTQFGQNDLKIFFLIFSRPEHEKWWVIW